MSGQPEAPGTCWVGSHDIYQSRKSAFHDSKQPIAQQSFNFAIISDKLISQIHPKEGWNIMLIMFKLKEWFSIQLQ